MAQKVKPGKNTKYKINAFTFTFWKSSRNYEGLLCINRSDNLLTVNMKMQLLAEKSCLVNCSFYALSIFTISYHRSIREIESLSSKSKLADVSDELTVQLQPRAHSYTRRGSLLLRCGKFGPRVALWSTLCCHGRRCINYVAVALPACHAPAPASMHCAHCRRAHGGAHRVAGVQAARGQPSQRQLQACDSQARSISHVFRGGSHPRRSSRRLSWMRDGLKAS